MLKASFLLRELHPKIASFKWPLNICFDSKKKHSLYNVRSKQFDQCMRESLLNTPSIVFFFSKQSVLASLGEFFVHLWIDPDSVVFVFVFVISETPILTGNCGGQEHIKYRKVVNIYNSTSDQIHKALFWDTNKIANTN